MTHALMLIRRWFFTGVLVFLPFIGSVALFIWVFGILDNWIQPLAKQYFGREIPGLGLALLLVTTFTIGAVVSNFVGKRLMIIVEGIIARIPAFSVVYKLLKDFANTFLSKDKGGFREVVALRFPTENCWAVGFVTGPVPPALAAVDPDEKVLVFVMMAFSPATGFLVAVPRSSVIKLDMPVEEAIKLVLTGGLVKAPTPVDAYGNPITPPASPTLLPPT